MPRIVFNPASCSGCKICQQVCAYKAFGVQNLSKSKIVINTVFKEEGPVFHKAYVCRHCEYPQCVKVCPTGALHVEDGIVKLDRDRCIACWSCVNACPYNAIFRHPELDFPLICDLCGGDPECVKWCPMNALSLQE